MKHIVQCNYLCRYWSVSHCPFQSLKLEAWTICTDIERFCDGCFCRLLIIPSWSFRYWQSCESYFQTQRLQHTAKIPPQIFKYPFHTVILKVNCIYFKTCWYVILDISLWIRKQKTERLPDKTMLPDSAVVERSFIEPRTSYEAFAFLLGNHLHSLQPIFRARILFTMTFTSWCLGCENTNGELYLSRHYNEEGPALQT